MLGQSKKISNSRNLSPAMNNSHWQTWPFLQPSFGNQQQQPFIPFPIPLQPLSQPPITPAGGLGYAQQTPSWGRSLPMRYQNSYGRRQAAAPYTLQPTRHESLGSIGRDHPTGAYLGMAHTGNSDSGAGGVWRPQPVIEEKQQTQCWIQFGTDHSGPWFSLEEGRTDSVHVLYFEVTYDDPESMLISQPILY